MPKGVLRIALAVSGAALAIGAIPATASAATTGTHAGPQAVGPMAVPPACVSATYKNPPGPYQDVYVHNHCPTSQRVKVIWAFATDSACHVIAAGNTYKDHHLNQNVIDRFDGLRAC